MRDAANPPTAQALARKAASAPNLTMSLIGKRKIKPVMPRLMPIRARAVPVMRVAEKLGSSPSSKPCQPFLPLGHPLVAMGMGEGQANGKADWILPLYLGQWCAHST